SWRREMCLMVMAVGVCPDYPLILAANRDEFDDRPASPAHFWPDAPWILAGRDRRGGGTWLGVSTSKRLAMLTNVRDPNDMRPHRPSRGALVTDYLRGQKTAAQFRARLRQAGPAYNGFNLVFGTGSELSYFSNRGHEKERIPAGVHGLSNAFLNTPWPKVQKARAAMAVLLQGGRSPRVDELFHVLADTTRPPDEQLPKTGIGLDRERILAPICVHTQGYGTQVSTLVFVHKSGRIDFWEKDVRGGGKDQDGPGANTLRHFTVQPCLRQG
ncbi:MAG: NRDE family protein, partial [Desulfovermiculus sp.]